MLLTSLRNRMPSRVMEAVLSHEEVRIYEHQEAEQGQVQGPGAGLEQAPVSLQAGRWKDWDQPCQKGLGGTGCLKTTHDPVISLTTQKAKHSLCCIQSCVASCSSALCWWNPSWGTASSSGVLSTGNIWTCYSGSGGKPQRWSEGQSTSPVKTDGVGVVQPGEEKALGTLLCCVFRTWWGL